MITSRLADLKRPANTLDLPGMGPLVRMLLFFNIFPRLTFALNIPGTSPIRLDPQRMVKHRLTDIKWPDSTWDISWFTAVMFQRIAARRLP